jgi:hypothetical protein
MAWRVVLQVPVANQFKIQDQLRGISEMNPLHEAAGGSMRSFTLTVSDQEAAAAIGEYAASKLVEAVSVDGEAVIVEVSAEQG